MPGVYISWPFCAQKCTYCNFASGVQPALEAEYPGALLREIAATDWSAWTPDTIYFGGGTPSGMAPETLQEILAAIPGHPPPKKPWKEATMEAAPGSLIESGITAWQAFGINRVSLGVQSFVDAELRQTGRRHSAATVRSDVALLRQHGLTNINLDLIAGLPGQTEASWRESLDAVIALHVPHVSVYMLEVDEDSRLGLEILNGGARYGAGKTPSDDAIATFYETAVAALADAGIHRYEISNFARPGFESAHNLKYWRREPYFGFGSDAHSFDGATRWQNTETAADYIRLPSPRTETTTARPEEERFFVGLRLSEGIEPTAEDLFRYGPLFDRLLSDGLLERNSTRLRLTPRGIMVSNDVLQQFLAD